MKTKELYDQYLITSMVAGFEPIEVASASGCATAKAIASTARIWRSSSQLKRIRWNGAFARRSASDRVQRSAGDGVIDGEGPAGLAVQFEQPRLHQTGGQLIRRRRVLRRTARRAGSLAAGSGLGKPGRWGWGSATMGG